MHRTKIRSLDFTLLLVLQGLLRYRRTVDVANELGLSQPAISHALRRLRTVFDDPLFVRKPHGLEPTRHALELGPLVESMLTDAQRALGVAEEFEAATSERDFRIAAPDLLGPVIAPGLLGRLETEAPRARFALRALVGGEAIRALEQDRLDVAIGQFPAGVGGLEVTHLYDDEYVLATRKRHATAGRSVTRRTLSLLGFVAINAEGAFRGFTDEDFAREGLERRIVASVPRFSTALEMVKRTNAAVLAPRRLAEIYAGPLKLELRPLPIRMAPFRVLLLSKPTTDAGRDWLIGVVRRTLVGA